MRPNSMQATSVKRGRPKLGEGNERVTLFLRPKAHRQIDLAAAAMGLTRSQFLEAVAMKHLRELPDKLKFLTEETLTAEELRSGQWVL